MGGYIQGCITFSKTWFLFSKRLMYGITVNSINQYHIRYYLHVYFFKYSKIFLPSNDIQIKNDFHNFRNIIYWLHLWAKCKLVTSIKITFFREQKSTFQKENVRWLHSFLLLQIKPTAMICSWSVKFEQISGFKCNQCPTN